MVENQVPKLERIEEELDAPEVLGHSIHKTTPETPPRCKEAAINGHEETLAKEDILCSWLDRVPNFYSSYNKLADFDDKEFIKSSGGNLDTLLIFAGLFSAVNTAFIIESMKFIQHDRVAETNELIRFMYIALSQNDSAPFKPLPNNERFVPSPQSVRSTTMLFASLSCSLTTAFGAVLGKQWLSRYEHRGGLKTPASRARERQKKYEGRASWRMEGIIGALSTILQLSLFIFFAALVDFLWSINFTCASVVMSLMLVGVGFYFITTTIATIRPLSPFQTNVSVTLRAALRALPPLVPKFVDALLDLFEDPFSKVVKRLGLMERLDDTPVILRQFCVVWIILVLWPPCLMWRFGCFAIKQLRGLTHYPAYCTVEVEGFKLSLKCLTYYADRASTREDFVQLIEAMNALPDNLKLSSDHPILVALERVLYRFAIDDVDGWETLSSLGIEDFKHFLKHLCLYYSRWRHFTPIPTPQSAPYIGKATDLVWKRTWAALAREPKNPALASLAVKIFDTPAPCSYYGQNPITLCNDPDIFQQVLVPSILHKKEDSIPYINLLAIVLNNSKNNLPKFSDRVDPASLVPALLHSLSKPTDDDPLSTLVWAELLPDHLQDVRQLRKRWQAVLDG